MTQNVSTPESYGVGNGVSTSFPTNFPFIAPSDLVVGLVTAGVEAPTTFTTTGGNYAPGSVVLGVPPAIGVLVHIRRRTSLDQLTDYLSNDGFPAESHERGLDKLTLIVQEHGQRLGLVESGAAAEGLSILNLGAGVQVLAGTVGGQVQARTLTAGSGISFVQSATEIQITAGVAGGALVAANNLSDLVSVPAARSNLGLGTAALSAATSFLAVSSNLSDVASRQVSLNNLTAVGAATNEHVLTKDTGSGNAIWKAVPGGGGGEANTSSNLPGGVGIAAAKVGVDLPFKSLAIGLGIAQAVDANKITHSIDQTAALAWTAVEKFHGTTAVPTLPGDAGITSIPNLISNATQYVTRTAPSPGAVEVRGTHLMYLNVPSGAQGYEWGYFGILDSSDNVGNNTPLYMKSYKRGNGPIWGGVFEVARKGGSNAVNMYGIEITLQTDGTNTGGQTSGLAFFYGPTTTGASTASFVPYGFLVKNIFGEPNAVVGTAFKAEGKANYVVSDGVTIGDGIVGTGFANATGDYSSAVYDAAQVNSGGAAFRAKGGMPISFNGTGTAIDLVYNSGGSTFEYQRAGSWRFALPAASAHDFVFDFKSSATNWKSGSFTPTFNGAMTIKIDHSTTVYIPTCSNQPP